MLKIRLRRVGAKKQPSYRIVVAEATSPRDGRFLEVIGHYNPRTEPETVSVKADRANYWISVGAQPTRAVERLLRKGGAAVAPVEAETGAVAAPPPPVAGSVAAPPPPAPPTILPNIAGDESPTTSSEA